MHVHASTVGSESATVVVQDTISWDLNALLDSFEFTRTFNLPTPDGILNAAVNEVQLWSPHEAVVLEEDASGNWVKVEDITVRVFEGVLASDPFSEVNVAIDAVNQQVAGSVSTEHFLYGFDSDGPDNLDPTKTSVQVTVYLRGEPIKALQAPSASDSSEIDLYSLGQSIVGLGKNIVGRGELPQDQDDVQPENHLDDLDRHVPGVTVPPVPDSLPLQHGSVPRRGCIDPSEADAAYCLQVIPYLDNAGKPHDSACRIAYAFHMMHKMWDREVNIHLEPLAIRNTGTTWSTDGNTHMTSFRNYLGASSSRMPGGTDMAVVFTGQSLVGIAGGAYPPVNGLGNKDAAAIVQIRSAGNYDAGVHIDQAAAHEMLHVAGHGSYANSGIDDQGHYGQSKKSCMDHAWYGKCKRWEYNIMYPTFSPAMGLWMYANSEEAVESYSYKYL